jgi:3-oxoacyl-[acyl-carrier-protein] synthase-3
MQAAAALIRSGIASTGLLVGADVHTSIMPFSKRTWEAMLDGGGPLSEHEREWNNRFRHMVVLFGNAVGAMVFQASEAGDGRGVLGSRLYADGSHKEILYVPGGGSARRPWVTAEMIERGETVPVMDGRQVFKLAASRMPEVTLEGLRDQDYGVADLDLVVMHQANLRINEAARKALGLPEEKVFNNIQKYGNTTSATLPLAFHESKAPEGALVGFIASGAGLHWGSVLMRV